MKFLDSLKMMKLRASKLIPLIKSIPIKNDADFNEIYRNSIYKLLRPHAHTVSCKRGDLEWILDIED